MATGGLCTSTLTLCESVIRGFCTLRGFFRPWAVEAELPKPRIKMFRDELVIVQMWIGSIDAFNLLSLSAT